MIRFSTRSTYTFIAIIILFFSAMNVSYSWTLESMFQSEIIGRWEQENGLVKATIEFHPDGTAAVSGVIGSSDYRYTVDGSRISITMKNFWGSTVNAYTGTFSIQNNILTLDSYVLGSKRWIKVAQ